MDLVSIKRIKYKTYCFEFWILFFKWDDGDSIEDYYSADEIAKIWTERKFGNLGRAAGTLLFYPFSIISFIKMLLAKKKASANGTTDTHS